MADVPPSQDRCGAPADRGRITDLYTHPAEYVTLQAFATYLGVQERTVMKWIDGGLLVAHRFPLGMGGGEIRIRKTDAIVFVAGSRIKPVTDGDTDDDRPAKTGLNR
jgi:excisionase family DNA binding protein